MILSMNSSVRLIWELADYVPFVSSAKSLYCIFQKYAFADEIDLRREIYNYDYLEKGSWSRQFVLLFPFAGNITILAYDLLFSKERLELASESNRSLEGSSPAYSFDTIAKSMKSFRPPQGKNTQEFNIIAFCTKCFACLSARGGKEAAVYNDGVDSDISESLDGY